MASFDESVINYTQHASLEHRRSDSNYKVDQISIPVETLPNNGMIGQITSDYISDDVYFSKCWFIAMSQGLKNHGYDLEPLDLMQICGFMDQFEMIDTDKSVHRRQLVSLADIFNDIKIHVFVGFKKGDKWCVVPDHYDTFGQGPNIIRILDKGKDHFELITTDGHMFLRDVKTMTPEKAFQQQHEILMAFAQAQEDRRRAEEEHARLVKEEEDRRIQIEQDYQFALRLQQEDEY